MRSFAPTLIVTCALVGSLAACSTTGPTGAASCVPVIPSGEIAGYVEATGGFGSPPDVTFPTPLRTDGAQQAVIDAGEGAFIAASQIVDFQVSIFNGVDGELITQTAYDSEQPPVRRAAGLDTDILAELLQCAQVGSRISATATIADVFGAGALDPELGLQDDDSVVLVLDIEDSYLAKAQGTPQLGATGVPAVVTTPDGVPGITIPGEEPPTDLIVHTLTLGHGAPVAEGDQVVLHYTGVLWNTESVFDSSWERGVASTFTAASFEDDPTGVVPGLAEGLIGQTIGSQVVVVIPPEFGYPDGQAPASVPAGSTMVFVVDILGIED